MRRNDQSISNAGKIVEGKQKANAGFSRAPVIHLDLTQVVVPKKKTATARRRDCHDIALALCCETRQRRVVAENIVHFPLKATCKTLTPAAQRGALGTHMVKNAVGKCEENILRIAYYLRHEGKQSITNWKAFSAICSRPHGGCGAKSS